MLVVCVLVSLRTATWVWEQAAQGIRDLRTDKGAAAGGCIVNGKRIRMAKGVGSDGVGVSLSGCVLGVCGYLDRRTRDLGKGKDPAVWDSGTGGERELVDRL